MKELRFTWKRAWKSKAILFVFLFSFVFVIFHFRNTSQQQQLSLDEFSSKKLADINEGTMLERDFLVQSGLLPGYTQEDLAPFPVFQIESLSKDAYMAFSEGDGELVVQTMNELYDTYHDEYLTEKKSAKNKVPQFINLSPAGLAVEEEFRILQEKGYAYQDISYSLEGVHLMNHTSKAFLGTPLFILALFCSIFLFVKDETTERKGFRAIQPVPLWRQILHESLSASGLILLSYAFLLLCSLLVGTWFGDGFGFLDYPIATLTSLRTTEMSTVGAILLQRFIRIVPIALFVPMFTITIRSFIKDTRLVIVLALIFGVLMQAWALRMDHLVHIMYDFSFVEWMLNPMAAPYSADLGAGLRIPIIGVLVMGAYLVAVFLGLSLYFLRNRKVQDYQGSVRRENVLKRIQHYSQKEHVLPNFKFHTKKKLKSIVFQAVFGLTIVIVTFFFLQNKFKYDQGLRELMNELGSRLEWYEMIAMDSRSQEMMTDLKALKEIVEVAKEDPVEASFLYTQFYNRTVMYSEDFSENNVSLLIRDAWMQAVDDAGYPLSLAEFGWPQALVTPFQSPASTEQVNREKADKLRYLDDVQHGFYGGFYTNRFLFVGGLLLFILAVGLSLEMDKNRAIDFLNVQPVQGERTYLSNVFSQMGLGVVTLLLAIGLGAGVLLAFGATNYTDYPTVEYTQEQTEGDTLVDAKYLTRYLYDDEDLSSRSEPTVRFRMRGLWDQNKEMLILFFVSFVLIIATASIISLFVKNMWATSLLTLSIFVLGYFLVPYLKGMSWATPFPWFDFLNISSGASRIVYDEPKLLPKVGTVVLGAYTLAMTGIGLLIYKLKFSR